MRNHIFFALAIIFEVQVSNAWETCDGSPEGCLRCNNGGECVPTRYGDYRCKCPSNAIGSKCDIKLVLSGWIDGGNGYQYLLGTTPRTYEEAHKRCIRYNAKLAVHGPRNPKWVRDFANNLPLGNESWIGLHDFVTEGTLVWSDNILYTNAYQNNLNNQPINTAATDCGVVTRTVVGVFNTVRNCTVHERTYLCEKPIGYPAEVLRFESKNYTYTIITPAKYATSQRLCRYQGGRLAVRALENELIIKKALQYFSDRMCIGDLNVFVGYTDIAQEGIFKSYDGKNLTTSLVWSFGNPGPSAVTDDCLTVTPNYWAWLDDKNCNLLLPGLCEIPNPVKRLNEKECKSGKVCPENAICVVNEVSCKEECCCLDGYIETRDGNCTKDSCKSGHIRCGPNAFCTVIDDATNKQGCVCKEGFFSRPDITTQGCFDPCDGRQCGQNARCVVDAGTTVEKCVCNNGFLPNNTAEEGCFYDLCANGNITCGNNARCCILCEVTKHQGCICDDRFVPNPTPVVGCVDPCAGIACGSNARCVAEPNNTVGHCECYNGFLPNNTAEDGCFYDLCGNGNITCGNGAICGVLCNNTKLQGCSCLPGFLPNNTAAEGCFYDLCGNGNITCGNGAICGVLSDNTKLQGCSCLPGFLPNNTAAEGCFHDLCASGNITCGHGARCCVLCDATKLQGCTCVTGFLANNTANEGCVLDRCFTGNITCGVNARCSVVNENTKEQGCTCLPGFLPKPNAETRCVEPCNNVSCGGNARCVIDPAAVTGRCECDAGFLPNNTAEEGCFYDRCASGNITCGDNAKCCVLCNKTKLQGCSCLPGFLPNNTAEEGCFYDRCASGNITCGNNARCCVLCDKTKLQGCFCVPGFLPNNTAQEGCYYDQCGNGNITCGVNARCSVLNEETKEQGCTCLSGFVPNPNATVGCVDPCANVTCGNNARCVYERNKSVGQCECLDGFLPNNTAEEGCFYDRCASGSITCGDNAKCCVLCNITKLQGCSCLPGYLPNKTAEEGCFYDQCGNGNITCGHGARCCVLCDETKIQGCTCLSGFFPNNTAQEGCVYDQCTNQNITCASNARCALLNDVTKEQGCICIDGYTADPTPDVNCAVSDCTTLTALDIYFAEVAETTFPMYNTTISDPILTGISNRFRSSPGFTQFSAYGGTSILSFANFASVLDVSSLTQRPEGLATLTHLTELAGSFPSPNNVRADASDVLIVSGINNLTASDIPNTLQAVLVIAISDSPTSSTTFVPLAIGQAVNAICAWVLGGFAQNTTLFIQQT